MRNSPIFDILTDPIGVEDLQKLRVGALARLVAIRRLLLVAAASTVLAGLLVLIATLHLGEGGITDTGRQAAAGPEVLAVFLGGGATAVTYVALALGYMLLAPKAWNVGVASKLVHNLEELRPETHPEKCMELADICRADQVVQAYVQKLARMERFPTIAEHQAALTWFGDAAARKKVDAARAACTEMGIHPARA